MNAAMLPLTSPWLCWGAVLSGVAALLHMACIVGGPAWYRFFGAGEHMARLADAGHVWPAFLTLLISNVLWVWAAYALGASGLVPALRGLPWMKGILLAITAVYVVRGLAPLPLWLWLPAALTPFAWWSSAICLGLGLVHLRGLAQVWERL